MNIMSLECTYLPRTKWAPNGELVLLRPTKKQTDPKLIAHNNNKHRNHFVSWIVPGGGVGEALGDLCVCLFVFSWQCFWFSF